MCEYDDYGKLCAYDIGCMSDCWGQDVGDPCPDDACPGYCCMGGGMMGGCQSDADCQYMWCDPFCKSGKMVCDTTMHMCVDCKTDADCSNYYPSCQKGMCVPSGTTAGVEICDDGWDNDGDYMVDCMDTDCKGAPCGPSMVCKNSMCLNKNR